MKERKVTIKDVAAEAGVSIATVSYVVNNMDKVADETRKKVNLAIEKLKYEPNIAARSLVKMESRTIGIMLSTDLQSALNGNPFFQELISGIEYRCKEIDYNTLMITIDSEDKFLNIIKSGTLAGVIILGYIRQENDEIFSNVSIPVIKIDQERTTGNFIYLNTEDEKGAFLAVEYLIKNGHKNIGLLSGSIWSGHIHNIRFEGYRAALEKYNIELKKEYLYETNVTYEGGKEAAQSISKKVGEITAIFCTTDIVALGLIKGLYEKSIYVPKDLSVIGFDNIKNSKYFIPELTTISQNIFERGVEAVNILMDAPNGLNNSINNEYVFPVELIERESVRKINV